MALKKSQQSLKNWTKEEWTTGSGKPSLETGEAYRPKKEIKRLKKKQRKKRKNHPKVVVNQNLIIKNQKKERKILKL